MKKQMNRARTNKVFLALTVVITLLIGGGVALASTGSLTEEEQILACVRRNGVPRIVDSHDDCRRNETLISWNQAGPVGPAGADGAQGPEGPPGAPGSNIGGAYVREVQADGGASVALCDGDDVATGGGGVSLQRRDLKLSRPVTRADGQPIGWEVNFDSGFVTAYVVCLPLGGTPPPSTTVPPTTATTTPSTIQPTVSTVPSSTATTGTVPSSATTTIDALSAPVGLAADVRQASVLLTWQNTPQDGLVGYTVFRDGAPVGTAGAGTARFLDRNVEQGQSYTYQVRANGPAGAPPDNSPLSGPINVTLPGQAGGG